MPSNAPLPDSVRIAVIGMGYVGLPLALAFARAGHDTLGFDIDAGRIAELAGGVDRTGEADAAELAAASGMSLSADEAALAGCTVFIVAVPTPVNRHKWPDLAPLEAASRMVGRCLKRGDVVVYESTVYPGATEEVCVPLLEATSGLRLNVDFSVGYSPERINPGDRSRRLPDIVKVTSGSSPGSAAYIDALYRGIIPAGTHLAPDIRTAEAAKAIENTQRDVNIALVNELAMMLGRLGMDTGAVLEAAGTKWNFLPFRPGLVGGHCIGVDPYYLIHKSTEAGHHPELITAARRINEGMAGHVVGQLSRLMASRRIPMVDARVLVLGATFKEDCPDLRNSQVRVVVAELLACHARVDLHDPWVDPRQCEAEFGLAPVDAPEPGAYDAVLLAVAHREFRALGTAGVRAFLRPGGVVYDVKHLLPAGEADARL